MNESPAADSRLAQVLGLPADASAPEFARRLAILAKAPGPEDPDSEAVWLSLAQAITTNMIDASAKTMEDAEAAHYVISQLFAGSGSDWEVGGRSAIAWERWLRVLDGQNPDDWLRPYLIREIAPRVAAAGYFEMV